MSNEHHPIMPSEPAIAGAVPTPGGYDLPHPGVAHDHGHHGHLIIPMRTLVIVLTILLVFTGATVLAANLEQIFARMFDITIPQWVNVVVALSIAAVKSIIVAAYFMQLRYDNPLNTLIAVFTILTVSLFLGFTMIDLGTRDAIYDYKFVQLVKGGVGDVTMGDGVRVQPNVSVAQYARQKADQTIDEMLKSGQPLPHHFGLRLAHRVNELHAVHEDIPALYSSYLMAHPELVEEASHGHGHGRGHAHAAGSNANLARPKSGITLPELRPAGADPHAAPHGQPKPPQAEPLLSPASPTPAQTDQPPAIENK